MSVKQKLRALERKLATGKRRWVTKLTDDLGHVIWSPREPREGERVHEIHIGGVDINEV
jgi:hypothetical protein